MGRSDARGNAGRIAGYLPAARSASAAEPVGSAAYTGAERTAAQPAQLSSSGRQPGGRGQQRDPVGHLSWRRDRLGAGHVLNGGDPAAGTTDDDLFRFLASDQAAPLEAAVILPGSRVVRRSRCGR